MIKYPKIKALGHEENEDIFSNPIDEIIIQEKMDGANFRFTFIDNKLVFGSRTQEFEEEIPKNFRRCLEHIKDKAESNPITGFIFFGECMVRHTMPYDWDKIPPFLGFDIYNIEEDKWLSTKEAKSMFSVLSLEFVPIIDKVQSKNIIEYTDKNVPTSKYFSPSSKDQQAEGVVFKNINNGINAKYVRDAFKEANRDTFGGSVKYSEDDSGKIVAKFCTNPRIEKNIFKLLDDGNKLELPLMAHLPKAVYQDIMEEEWKVIVNSNMIVDFRKLRKQVTRRCLGVLKQMITNNALIK